MSTIKALKKTKPSSNRNWTKWEYTIVDEQESEDPKGILKLYGAGGWELVSATIERLNRGTPHETRLFTFIFKRPKEN